VLLSMLYSRIRSAPRSGARTKFPVGSAITLCGYAASCLDEIVYFPFVESLKICGGCAPETNDDLKVEIVEVWL